MFVKGATGMRWQEDTTQITGNSDLGLSEFDPWLHLYFRFTAWRRWNMPVKTGTALSQKMKIDDVKKQKT